METASAGGIKGGISKLPPTQAHFCCVFHFGPHSDNDTRGSSEPNTHKFQYSFGRNPRLNLPGLLISRRISSLSESVLSSLNSIFIRQMSGRVRPCPISAEIAGAGGEGGRTRTAEISVRGGLGGTFFHVITHVFSVFANPFSSPNTLFAQIKGLFIQG